MFDTFKSRYHKWNLYKRTVRELESLTNRELADLGISRADIHSIARDAVQGA